ncbi:cAMP-dependent protein kinase type II regulatory subunit-like isoform X2 [Artemia franciscana]|uniref:cAMP-dependent protein kinase type II regulatory subunit-like isoform X2 n=1 Tax=Artemia franciscana TaxID=6661 RepID=UPI0032D9D305
MKKFFNKIRKADTVTFEQVVVDENVRPDFHRVPSKPSQNLESIPLKESVNGNLSGTKSGASNSYIGTKSEPNSVVGKETGNNNVSNTENEDVRGKSKQESDTYEQGFKPPARGYTRRKSVFAEAYDPENDADEGEKVVYPKSDLQRSRLADAVRNILLFRSLDPEQMQDVLDAMFEKTVSAGEYVIKQGDDGDNFYVIESGLYNIYVADNDGQPKLVGNYDNVGSFGELALMYNMPRAATIQAVSSGLLWAMDRPTFRRILLKTAFRKRKMYEQLLESVPMLGTLTSYERMNLADALVSRTYTDGTCIIRQGDPADGMFFVEDGLLRISIVGDNGQEAEVSRVTKGGYFGELALVTHRPRAASVYAIGNVRLAFLDVDAFERLLGPCMDVMKRSIEVYEDQLVKLFGSAANISDARSS